MTHPLAGSLHDGAAALGVSLSDHQLRQLTEFADWLVKWNRVYNLTALRNPDEVLTHHLLDSLSVVGPLRRHLASIPPLEHAPRLLDVGSGGGLPGIVLAIACPEVSVTCVDAVAKKALFVTQVAAAVRIPNLRGVHARVEQLDTVYDVITSRAFASLADFTAWSRQALAPAGVWMAMKGKRPDDEMADLRPSVEVFHVEPARVPMLNAERCIVWLRPAQGQSAEST